MSRWHAALHRSGQRTRRGARCLMAGGKQEQILQQTADGTEYRIPVGIINGASPGKQVTILSGQHGTEYDGIEAVQRLYRTTDPERVRGRIVIALILNLDSFQTWT